MIKNLMIITALTLGVAQAQYVKVCEITQVITLKHYVTNQGAKYEVKCDAKFIKALEDKQHD